MEPRRLLDLLPADGRSETERRQLVRLMRLFADLSAPPSADELFPRYRDLHRAWRASCRGSDGELVEERFLELYAHLHMHEAPYTPAERRTVDAAGGYWSHAGGLSPILRAEPWIRRDTTSVDLGAGNGLQGLLLQKLYPHRRCCQIEISSAMADIGRRLQTWLGIPNDRVEWRVDDVLTTPLGGWSFVYLYRPVRPEGAGAAFYRRLADALDRETGEVVVFSIADCLADFLPHAFECFSTDGHLTCYRRRGA